MLIGMADESGMNENSNFFSMAAFVADHSTWKEFNPLWRAVLAKQGLDHFHMWQFAGYRGPFKGWTENKRRQLMAELLEVIARFRLLGIGAVVRIADYTRLPLAQRKAFIGPYMICFYETVYGLGLVAEGGFPGERLSFIYSQQDEFKAQMTRYWNHAKAQTDYGSELGILSFQSMKKVPGLQAADLLAWEIRHFYHLREVRPDLPMRYPLRMLVGHQRRLDHRKLKYLPGWYVEFQVKGVHAEAMKVIFSDLDQWQSMYADIHLPGMEKLVP